MKKVIGILVFVIVAFAEANGPDTLWTKYYGYVNADKAFSIHETADSGYIIAGYATLVGYDVYLVRINSSGDSLWTKAYGGDRDQIGYSVDVTTDGGYVVAAGAPQGFYLLRLTPTGDTLWTKTYSVGGGPAYSVRQTSDGGFIMGGAHGYHAMLIKTDYMGNEEWIKEYALTGDDNCFSVIQTSDGGYLFTGYTLSDLRDLYLQKTDSLGDTLWHRFYGSSGGDIGHAVMETSDHYYITVGGISEEMKRWPGDAYIIKWDQNGNMIWDKIVGTTSDDVALGVTETPDSCYAITGYTYSYEYGQYNFYLIKMDRNGDTLWTGSYSRGGDEWSHSVIATADGGYLMCGWGLHSPYNYYDVFLIRTKPYNEIEEKPSSRNESYCLQVAPNPFRDQVKINIKSPAADKRKTELSIYNSTGRRIKTFQLSPDNLPPFNSLTWNGRDDQGNSLPNGVYLLKYATDGYISTTKITLIK